MMKYIRDVDLARKTLFKGIRIHKKNKKLYLELFKVELDFAARKRKETKEGKENFLRCICVREEVYKVEYFCFRYGKT